MRHFVVSNYKFSYGKFLKKNPREIINRHKTVFKPSIGEAIHVVLLARKHKRVNELLTRPVHSILRAFKTHFVMQIF